MDLKSKIRNVPDFPKKGIGFKDITTLLQDGEAFREAVRLICEPHRKNPPDIVAGVESRGFIFGAAVAAELGAGFVPIRKPGKLPAETVRETYSLEYGQDAIEMHKDAFGKGSTVLLVDDLLATGGTAEAAVRLIRRLGGRPVGAEFLIELSFLAGRKLLKDIPVHSLIVFDSE